MNLLAYAIYILITYLITVHAGLALYRNGRIYILQLLDGDESLTDQVNRILLTGYYLVNLGYAALKISSWQTIITFEELVSSLSSSIGNITLLLAVLHYINMTVIALWHEYQHSISKSLKNKKS